jgi:hypothetical protein
MKLETKTFTLRFNFTGSKSGTDGPVETETWKATDT